LIAIQIPARELEQHIYIGNAYPDSTIAIQQALNNRPLPKVPETTLYYIGEIQLFFAMTIPTLFCTKQEPGRRLLKN